MRGSFRFLFVLAIIFSTLAEARLHAQATAILTVRDNELCRGDSVIADILISGGTAPYTLVISSHLEDLDTLKEVYSPVEYWMKPFSSTDIRISYVEDATGTSGTAPRMEHIEVLPVTQVEFILDRDDFLQTEGGIALGSSPSGATFFGNGVLGSVFYPGVAGVGSHELGCVLTNANGCQSRESKEVEVIYGEADLLLLQDGEETVDLCDAEASYELVGSNQDGLSGLFRLRRENETSYLEGYIVDQDSSDNQALLEPEGLWGDFVLEYHCESGDLQWQADLGFSLNDLSPLTMEGFPELICSADEPYALSPGNIPVEEGCTYAFSGHGIGGSQEEGFYFDPGHPDASSGGSLIIQLDLRTKGGCQAHLDKIVKVNYSPEVSFAFSPSCLPLDGGTVEFTNTSTGQYSVERWEWSFGDPESGNQNSSSEKDPEHFYAAPGDYKVVLQAYTTNGCVSSSTSDTILPDNPMADFSWVHDCYVKGEKTSFFSSSTSTYSEIDSLQWTFKTSAGLVLGVLSSTNPEEEMKFPFSSMDSYRVVLDVWDQVGCHDQDEDVIDLQPSLDVAESGYLEDFDQGEGAWKSYGDPDSWSLGLPDFAGYEGLATDKGWFTDFPGGGFEEIEHSGIQSPCLDLGSVIRPVVSMEMMRSFRPGEDGAVLQYNRGDGQGWRTLGSVGSGGNWYNLTNIENVPGGSAAGWGLQSFVPDSEWQLASHDISFLAGQKHVRFRIAQASGFDPDLQNQGFAVNNFRISEDLRTSLLEHFTNSAQEESRLADDVVDGFAWQNRLQLIDLQYHVDYPGEDPMNQNNSNTPETRAFYYGVSTIPFAILNGSAEADYRYDFTSEEEEPDGDLLVQESLVSAPFRLDLDVDWGEDGLEATVRTTCDVASFGPNIQLYVAVKERMIRAYTGLNGDLEFRNVVVDMLPSPAGKLLGKSWVEGQEDLRTFQWDYAEYVEDVDDLVVVAFVADRDNGGVLQAVAEARTSMTSAPERKLPASLSIYPNPATDLVYVNTGSTAEGSIQIWDLSGRKVLDQSLEDAYSIYQLDISTLTSGIYLVSYREAGQVKARAKLMKR